MGLKNAPRGLASRVAAVSEEEREHAEIVIKTERPMNYFMQELPDPNGSSANGAVANRFFRAKEPPASAYRRP